MDDENMVTKKLDKESLNDYNIYNDISNIYENKRAIFFIYKEGKILYLLHKFRYLMNNGQKKYFYNNSKIIYFTNKNEKFCSNTIFYT